MLPPIGCPLPVEAGEQWIGLVSVIAKGFQGYITATCGFRDAFGFAFLANGYGVGAPTAAAELSRCMHGLRLRRAIVQRLLA